MSKDIPPIPSTVAADLQRPLQRMREELQRLLGFRGDDRAITTGNAASLGVLAGLASGGGTGTGTGTGGTAYEPDLTPPPSPTFETGDATGGMTNVLLTWSGVTYTQGHGNLQTIIYGVKKDAGDPTLPTFPGNAGIVATAPNPLTIYALPSEPNTRWHLWLKFETVDGVLSADPAGGINGVMATTGQDISQLLEVLAGSITSSELAAALNTRINLIDGSSAVAGSVNARILAETDARTLALADEVAARILALGDEVDARLLAEGALQTQIDLLDASTGGDLTAFFAALTAETSSRIEADLAAANAITLAGATIADTAFGLSVEQGARALAESILAANAATTVTAANNTAAGLALEQQIRAGFDGAIASQSASLAVAAGDNAGAVRVEQIARATADDAQASNTAALAAAGSTTAAALLAEQVVRASADDAQATSTITLAAAGAGTAAALQIEQDARAGADAASAGQLQSLAAAVASANAAIVFEQDVRSSADSATASQVQSLAASVGGGDGVSAAAIVIEQLARAAADSAMAEQTATLTAATAGNQAAITIEQQSRTDADSAAAAQSTTLGANTGAALAGLVLEQAARTNDVAALATQNLALVSTFAGGAAALTVEQVVRATADSASASQADVMGASLGANTAAIQLERETRAGDDGASAVLVASLLAVAGDTTAGILTEQQIRAGADMATAAQVQSLAAAMANSNAAIVMEQDVRSNADAATAAQVLSIASSVGLGTGESTAALVIEQQTRAAEDEALAAQSTTLQAELGVNKSALDVEQLARVTADSANAAQTSFLGVTAGTSLAGLQTEQAVRAAADSATSAQSLALVATFADAAASLTVEQQVRSAADVVTASQVTVLGAKIDSNVGSSAAAIQSEQDARVTADTAAATAAATLAAATGTAAAAIRSEQDARTASDGATASQLSTLTASVGSNTAALAVEAAVRAGQTGDLFGQYSVKLDLNGYMSGYGLTSSLIAGTPATSTFLVSVDKFAVMTPPSSVVNWIAGTTYALNDIRGVSGNTDKVLVCKQAGTASGTTPAIAGAIGAMLTDGGVRWQIASRVPFSVLTSNTTINGISVPAGVYIDGAYMLNATVGNAQIGNLAVDNAKIADVAVAKLLGGNLSVGGYIESTGYTSGPSGAGYRIDRDSVVLPATSIRGQITAEQFNGNGASINAPDGTPIFRAGVAVPADYMTQGQFQADRAWTFFQSTSGWTNLFESSLTTGSASMTVTATGSYPSIASPACSIYGPGIYKVRMRLRLLSGAWGPVVLYYSNQFHGLLEGYRKQVPAPAAAIGEWVVVEFDMSALTSGGNDWVISTINQIQIHFSGASSGHSYEIDWISVGSMAPGSYGAPLGSPVGNTSAEVVAAATAAVNDGATGLARRLRDNARNVLAGAGGFATGSLTWDTGGAYAGGYGIGFSQGGIVGVNSSGVATFVLDGATGNATFGGALSAATGEFAGSLNVRSAGSGSRIEIVGDSIKVYEGSTLRVKIGNLA